MAITVFPLRSLRVYEETSGNFAVDHSATPADFVAVPAQPDSLSFDPGLEMLDPNVLQQYMGGRTIKVPGPKSTTLEATVPLHGSGLQGSVSEAAATKDSNALFRMLATVFGGIEGGGNGSKIESASSASVVTVTNATDFKAGGCLGWTNSDSELEMVPIQSVTSNTITTKIALSATPSTNDDIYVATTFYIDESTGSHLQFLAEGLESDDYWSIRGCQLDSLSLNLPFGEMPTIGFSFKGADWSNLGSGSLSQESYSNAEFIAFNGGTFLTQVVGTATRKTTDSPSVTIEPQISYIPVKSHSGTNTIAKYKMQQEPPMVSGNFMPYYEDQTWYNARANKTKYLLALQIGTANNRGVLFEVPTAQITSVSGPQDSEGLTGTEVGFEGGLDEDAGDQSARIERSPVKMHFIN